MDDILIDIFGEDCREFCELFEEPVEVIDVEGKYKKIFLYFRQIKQTVAFSEYSSNQEHPLQQSSIELKEEAESNETQNGKIWFYIDFHLTNAKL